MRTALWPELGSAYVASAASAAVGRSLALVSILCSDQMPNRLTVVKHIVRAFIEHNSQTLLWECSTPDSQRMTVLSLTACQ